MGVSYDSSERRWTVRRNAEADYRLSLVQDLQIPPRAEMPSRFFVVIDRVVQDRHRAVTDRFLSGLGVPHLTLALDGGEEMKGLSTVSQIWAELDAWGAAKTDALMAIGGGALLDAVGFSASTYRHGLRWWRLPTTLTALVDAGVARMVQINFADGKNRLGNDHPAAETLLFPRFLRGLPKLELSSGAGEILKVAIMRDARLFDLLAGNWLLLTSEEFQGLSTAGARVATEVIERAVGGMLDELDQDGYPRLMDFGHTWSPAWEMSSHTGRRHVLRHGEAVTLDMSLSVMLATRRGLLSVDARDRILRVMLELGLPVWDLAMNIPELLDAGLEEAMAQRNGRQWVPLPVGIGSATCINDCEVSELIQAERELRAID